MSIKPNEVIGRLEQCEEDPDRLSLLKRVLNTIWRQNMVDDIKIAQECSQILSAIHRDAVSELDPPTLLTLSHFLGRTPH